MPRKRFRRELKGKSGVKHAGTLLANIGSGIGTITKQIIIESSSGTNSENVFELQDSAFSDETCRSGDCIKYVNIHIQVAPRGSDDTRNGWLEYAVVWKREDVADVSNTRIGILTLGTIATNFYRNKCIWTGFIPVGKAQANGTQLRLKMPKDEKYLKDGREFVLFVYYRSNLSTDVTTDSTRVILSYNYKAYS